MNEEVNALVDPAASAAPEAGGTAASVDAPVSGETKPEAETKEERLFTQAELEAKIGKRLAREERKWQREKEQAIAEAARAATPKTADAKAPEKPNPDSFKSNDEYLEALTDWKADQKFNERFGEREKADREARVRAAQNETLTAHREREEVAREKYDDFDEVVFNPKLPITDAMARTMQESDSGPEVAYYLGKNAKEAARIAQLSPFLQAKELGRIEAKLAANPPAKTSAAPDPINPIAAKGNSAAVYDTTDPRSIKAMTDSEWIEADRKRQEKKWAAQHR